MTRRSVNEEVFTMTYLVLCSFKLVAIHFYGVYFIYLVITLVFSFLLFCYDFDFRFGISFSWCRFFSGILFSFGTGQETQILFLEKMSKISSFTHSNSKKKNVFSIQ